MSFLEKRREIARLKNKGRRISAKYKIGKNINKTKVITTTKSIEYGYNTSGDLAILSRKIEYLLQLAQHIGGKKLQDRMRDIIKENPHNVKAMQLDENNSDFGSDEKTITVKVK